MSMVILEGTDATGKTTLAERIATRYKVPFFHDGPPEDPEYAFYELVRDVEMYREACVWDRFHLGNFAYGTVFRGKSDMVAKEIELLEDMLNRRGCVLILCEPPILQVSRSLSERVAVGGADPRGYEDDWHKVLRVRTLMREGWNQSGILHKGYYDYTRDHHLELVYAKIEEALGWVG